MDGRMEKLCGGRGDGEGRRRNLPRVEGLPGAGRLPRMECQCHRPAKGESRKPDSRLPMPCILTWEVKRKYFLKLLPELTP